MKIKSLLKISDFSKQSVNFSQKISSALFLTAVLIILIFISSCAGGLSRKEASKLYYNLGNSYFDLGDNQKATECYLKALDYDSNMKVASFNLTKAYVGAKKFDEALVILDNMLEDEPDNLTVLSAKAYCIYNYGDFEKAYEIYEKILTIDTGNQEAMYNCMAIKAQAGEYQNALDKFAVLKSKKIDDEKLLKKTSFLVGEIYYKMESYDKAIEYLEYIKTAEPNNVKNLKLLFTCYLKRRFYAKCVEVGKQIIKLQSNDKDTLFDMASVYLTNIGDTSTGISYLQNAISAGFSDKGKAKLLMDSVSRGAKTSIQKILVKEKLLD